MYDIDDTIAAIGTVPDGAARGMVRISGPQVMSVLSQCFTAGDGDRLDQIDCATAIPGRIAANLSTHVSKVDCDLYLWPNKRSYTRAPVAELHTLGSPPLLEELLAMICRAGARLAEPGEFTLRAFLAGRLDLTQAEAVLGVIDAHGQEELDSALVQLAGGLAQPLRQLRDELIQLLAELEAGLDFVDEDIQFISPDEVSRRLKLAEQSLEAVLAQLQGRGKATYLPQVAIVGPPNAGKSSLFNALVAQDMVTRDGARAATAAALVSTERGTTRDFLTAQLRLGDIECELVDTAGVDIERTASPPAKKPRKYEQAIDEAAECAATERRDKAEIRLWCVVVSSPNIALATLDPARDLVVLTKADLIPSAVDSRIDVPANVRVIATSSRTNRGLDELRQNIRVMLTSGTTGGPTSAVVTTAERCRESVRLAAEALSRAEEIVADQVGDELVASEIRVALDELGKVVGAVYTDDLLDRVFSTFCIGK